MPTKPGPAAFDQRELREELHEENGTCGTVGDGKPVKRRFGKFDRPLDRHQYEHEKNEHQHKPLDEAGKASSELRFHSRQNLSLLPLGPQSRKLAFNPLRLGTTSFIDFGEVPLCCLTHGVDLADGHFRCEVIDRSDHRVALIRDKTRPHVELLVPRHVSVGLSEDFFPQPGPRLAKLLLCGLRPTDPAVDVQLQLHTLQLTAEEVFNRCRLRRPDDRTIPLGGGFLDCGPNHHTTFVGRFVAAKSPAKPLPVIQDGEDGTGRKGLQLAIFRHRCQVDRPLFKIDQHRELICQIRRASTLKLLNVASECCRTGIEISNRCIRRRHLVLVGHGQCLSSKRPASWCRFDGPLKSQTRRKSQASFRAMFSRLISRRRASARESGCFGTRPRLADRCESARR